MPYELETRYALLVGATGTGKTTALLNVISQLRKRDEKVVLFDLKGDFLSLFYDPAKDKILNPLDKRCANWNVFQELKSPRAVQDFVSSFIPEPSTGNEVAKYFHDAARDVFSSILQILINRGQRSNADVWSAISSPISSMHQMLRSDPAGSVGLSHIEKPDSNQATGVRSTLLQYCRIFQELQYVDGAFSVRDWIRADGGGFLFLPIPPQFQTLLSPMVAVVINVIIKELLSLEDNLSRRRYIIVDEIGKLGKLNALIDGLTLGRSKGLSMWIGTQDFGPLDILYGRSARETI